MKKNDLADIKKLETKALAAKVKSLRAEVRDLYMDKNMNKLKNLRSIKSKRQDLAQSLTVLNQKNFLQNLEANNG